MADWRVAHSLEKLRSQVNAARPNRKKSADGTIGDQAHANRTSDHNPNVMDGPMGVVTALDLTHDPKGGFDSYKYAEILRTKKDKRIKYVISNKRIFSSTSSPWVWRGYTGSNPHSAHCHVSVMGTKSLYDSTAEWDLGDLFGGAAPPDVVEPDDEPVLRRGDQGPAVVELQKLLGKVEVDGYFGPNTEAAVTAFQVVRNLVPDGIVGAYTWVELKRPDPGPVNNPVMSNIVCTMFGGSADPNNSAYAPYDPITDATMGCALPFRFPGTRPQVKITNVANGLISIASIVDIGPWNTDDPYWTYPKGRPQAETGKDMTGRRTNLAGIDVTPAVDKAIKLDGFGKVNWEFAQAVPGGGGDGGTVPDYDALAAAADAVAKCAEQVAEASRQLAEATAALDAAINALNKP